jgi:hypothetical protein
MSPLHASSKGRPGVTRLLAATAILVASACGGGSPGDAMAADTPVGDGPCALLRLAEVQRVLPDTRMAERDRTLDKYDIASCVWKGDKGLRELTVQRWEGEDSAETELRGLVEGIVDPVKPGVAASIRYETLKSLGDDALAVVERADANRGVLTYAAILVVKRGNHVLTMFSSDLAMLERPEALKALETLGRAAVARLD